MHAALLPETRCVTAPRTDSRLTRIALLATAALAAFPLSGFGVARADCSEGPPATLTCTGHVGTVTIVPPSTLDTLVIRNVAGDAGSATSDTGFSFVSPGPVTINSDLSKGPAGGVFKVEARIRAINAQSNAGPVSVTSIGDASVTESPAKMGTAYRAAAIYAQSKGPGAVMVDSTGNVTSAKTNGIRAGSKDGQATVISQGSIIAEFYGISVFGAENVRLESTGNVKAGDIGLSASSNYRNVTIISKGDVSGDGTGIAALISAVPDDGSIPTPPLPTDSVETGDIMVTSTGNVTSLNGLGIQANVNNNRGSVNPNQSKVTVISKGNVGAQLDGIWAWANGNGKIKIDSTGDVTSAETNGLWGFSAYGGEVTIGSVGDVSAAKGSGIKASSAGDLSVAVNGLAEGGIAGVEFGDATNSAWGGDDNRLDVLAGSHVRNISPDSARLAILGRNGREAVVNSGTVTGSVDLGGGTDSFSNEKGATFLTGDTVYLGAGEKLSNSGNLDIGGRGTLLNTLLTGDYAQDTDGVFLIDFLPSGDPLARESDKLVVTGSASLSGTVKASQMPGATVTTEQEFVILTATGTFTSSGLKLIMVSPEYRGYLISNTTNLVLKIVPIGRFWDGDGGLDDGVVSGGAGVWNDSNLNWTTPDGENNNEWPQTGTAVFEGELGGGAITVVGPQRFGGLDFRKTGYVLQGDGTLVMRPELPGSRDASVFVDTGMTATVAAKVDDGSASYRLVKSGAGALFLSGANTFDGGVQLNLGTLGVGDDAALGTGALTMAETTTLKAMAAELMLGNAITVTGLSTIDTAIYTLTLDDGSATPVNRVSGTGSLNKDGAGTLILKDDSSLAGWDIRAGTLDNRAALVAAGAIAMSGVNTTLLNAAGASVTVNSGSGSISGAAGTQSISNAGAIRASIGLESGNDSYVLQTSGTQAGSVSGGEGTDFLQIETAAGDTRLLEQAAFTGFETVQLNLDPGSTGRISLGAATAPVATLDTGGGASTSVTLNRGELNLAQASASLRAETVTIGRGAVVSGVGLITNGAGTTTNAGTISPGNSPAAVAGRGNIGQISVIGNVAQTPEGVFYVDFKPDQLAANRASDVLVLSGNASLSGTVVASQWAGSEINAEQQFVILETTSGVVTTSGLALSIAPAPGYVASLEVLNNGTQLVLKFTAEAPAPPVEPPREITPDWAVAAAMGALNFSDTLIGCPRDRGAYAAIGEGQCLWMDSGGGYLDGDGANGNPGWDQTSWWIGGGGQLALSDVLRLGLAVRYEDTSLDQGGDASTSGSLWNAGASLTYTSGPVLLAAAASAGRGSFDTRRTSKAGARVSADHDLDYAHARLRAGYLFDYGAWYLKPLADLDATWMSYGGFSEEGGAGAVRAKSEESKLLSASPRLEIGGDVELENGVLLRPYLRAGATIYGDTGFDLGWRYVAGPQDAPVYEARSELDQVMADISAGLDLFGGNGLSARIYYDGSFGETIHSHAGGFTARFEF